jgi:hypothetical protein
MTGGEREKEREREERRIRRRGKESRLILVASCNQCDEKQVNASGWQSESGSTEEDRMMNENKRPKQKQKQKQKQKNREGKMEWRAEQEWRREDMIDPELKYPSWRQDRSSSHSAINLQLIRRMLAVKVKEK